MNIFKSTSFTWWQLGLLKWAVLFIGIVIGSVWPEIFLPYAMPLLIIGLVVSFYLMFVWFRNK